MAFLDTGSVPDGKIPLRRRPSTADVRQWLTPEEWNEVMADVQALRLAIVAAVSMGFTPQASRPAAYGAGGSTQRLWVRNSDKKLMYFDGTSDIAVGSGSGGSSVGVQTIADLLALPSAGLVADQVVELLGYHAIADGGGGQLVWSASSTATPNPGTVFKPTDISSGPGRWLRLVHNGVYDPLMFGAKNDLTFDSYPAFQALLDWVDSVYTAPIFPYGVGVHIQTGQYRLSATLRIKHHLAIAGDGIVNTQLFFLNNYPAADSAIDGIIFDQSPDISTLFQGSNFTTMRDLAVVGTEDGIGSLGYSLPEVNEYDPCCDSGTGAHPGTGIVIFRNVLLENVEARGFKYDGFAVNTRSGVDDNSHNANVWRMYDCLAHFNGRHGLFTMGTNSNGGTNTNFNAQYNGGCGIYERSFLGNRHIGGHHASNGHYATNVLALLVTQPDVNNKFQTRIIAGTGDAGVFQADNSGDPGEQWKQLPIGLQVADDADPEHSIRTAAICCLAQSARIYAGMAAGTNTGFTTGGGIFQADPLGTTWSRVNTGLTDLDVRSLLWVTGTVLLAGTHTGGVFKTTDEAANWSASNTGLGTLDVRALALDPDDHTIIYAGTYGGKVYKSTDSGASWTQVPTGFSSPNVLSLATASGVVYAGCADGKVYKTTDGGSNWSLVLTSSGAAAINALAINPIDNTKVYAATEGAGIYVSANAGSTWAQKTDANGLKDPYNVPTLNVRSIAVSNEEIVYAGVLGIRSNSGPGGFSWRAVFRSTNDGSSWADTGPMKSGGACFSRGGSTNISTWVGIYTEADNASRLPHPNIVIGDQLSGQCLENPIRMSHRAIEGTQIRARRVKGTSIFSAEPGLTTFTANLDRDDHALILIDCTDSVGAVALATPVDGDLGKFVTVMRTDAQTDNFCYVRALSSSIEGYGTDTYLNAQYESVTLVATMSGYRIIDRRATKPPVMTQTVRDAISSPETGLVVFNSTSGKLSVYDGAAWADVGGGGGSVAEADITDKRLGVSYVDIANANQSHVSDSAGNYTYGMQMVPLKDGITVAGGRCFWAGGHGAVTLKIRLDDVTNNVNVDSATVAANAAGVYEVTFGSTHTLTAGVLYTISVYEGSRVMFLNNTDITAINGVMALTDFLHKIHWPGVWMGDGCYGSGDTIPISADNTGIDGLCEPVFA